MAFFRTLLNFIVAGALLGLLSVMWAYPRLQTWYNTPGSGQALCNCSETTKQTAFGLIDAELTGAATGSGIGLVSGVAWTLFRRRRAQEAAQQAKDKSAPPPAPVKPAA